MTTLEGLVPVQQHTVALMLEAGQLLSQMLISNGQLMSWTVSGHLCPS